jgi:hypothetical protein
MHACMHVPEDVVTCIATFLDALVVRTHTVAHFPKAPELCQICVAKARVYLAEVECYEMAPSDGALAKRMVDEVLSPMPMLDEDAAGPLARTTGIKRRASCVRVSIWVWNGVWVLASDV